MPTRSGPCASWSRAGDIRVKRSITCGLCSSSSFGVARSWTAASSLISSVHLAHRQLSSRQPRPCCTLLERAWRPIPRVVFGTARRTVWSAACCALLVGVGVGARSGGLEYGRVMLTGTVARQTYPGPPDYRSIARGDEARVILVLLLEPGVCVVDPESRHPRERYQRGIQLLLPPELVAKQGNLLGNRVALEGELRFAAADHDKRVALGVDRLIEP